MAPADLHERVGHLLAHDDQRYTQARRRLVGVLAETTFPLTIPEIIERDAHLAQSSAYRNLVAPGTGRGRAAGRGHRRVVPLRAGRGPDRPPPPPPDLRGVRRGAGRRGPGRARAPPRSRAGRPGLDGGVHPRPPPARPRGTVRGRASTRRCHPTSRPARCATCPTGARSSTATIATLIPRRPRCCSCTAGPRRPTCSSSPPTRRWPRPTPSWPSTIGATGGASATCASPSGWRTRPTTPRPSSRRSASDR